MKKKIIKYAVILSGTLFIIFHGCWLYNYLLFTKYTDGLDEIEKFFVYASLEDGYVYNVGFPFYLSFTGNLAVSTSDDVYSLIIWPSCYKETEYGIIVPGENDTTLQIMIDKNLNAENIYDQPIVDKYKTQIQDLFKKTTERWGEIL